jgi:hypothetical protein
MITHIIAGNKSSAAKHLLVIYLLLVLTFICCCILFLLNKFISFNLCWQLHVEHVDLLVDILDRYKSRELVINLTIDTNFFIMILGSLNLIAC